MSVLYKALEKSQEARRARSGDDTMRDQSLESLRAQSQSDEQEAEVSQVQLAPLQRRRTRRRMGLLIGATALGATLYGANIYYEMELRGYSDPPLPQALLRAATGSTTLAGVWSSMTGVVEDAMGDAVAARERLVGGIENLPRPVPARLDPPPEPVVAVTPQEDRSDQQPPPPQQVPTPSPRAEARPLGGVVGATRPQIQGAGEGTTERPVEPSGGGTPPLRRVEARPKGDTLPVLRQVGSLLGLGRERGADNQASSPASADRAPERAAAPPPPLPPPPSAPPAQVAQLPEPPLPSQSGGPVAVPPGVDPFTGRQLIVAPPPGAPAPLDPAQLEQLLAGAVTPMAPPGPVVDLGSDTRKRMFIQVTGGEREGPARVRVDRHRAAHSALSVGRVDEAVLIYRDLLAENDRDPVALFGLASALHRAGDLFEAEQLYQRLLIEQPDNADALSNLMALIGRVDPGRAILQLEALLRTRPDYAPGWAQLARLHAEAGNVGAAVSAARRATTADPSNPFFAYNLAVIYDRGGQRGDAVEAYRAVLVALERNEAAAAGLSAGDIRARLAALSR